MFSVLLNVVDTYYAGLLSPSALAALSLAGPGFFLMITLGIGAGQACNALVGSRLGAELYQEARLLAMQSLSFAVTISVVASVIAYFLTPALFAMMGGEDPYLALSIDYMRVVLAATALFSVATVLNSILNTCGNTHSYRNAQMYAVIANIILDPLFMFTFGLGVVGVAVVSVLLQAGVVIYLARKVMQLQFMHSAVKSEFFPISHLYKEIAAQALPASAAMLFVASGGIVIVTFISKFGESTMAAYGVALRIEQLIQLLVIGLNIAALSITSVNYGAKQMARVEEVFRTSIRYALTLMLVGAVVLLLFAKPLMVLFTDDIEVQAIGVTYLRFQAFVFPALALTFLSAAILQGLKLPRINLYFNIARQLVGQLILFYIAVYVLELDVRGVWASILVLNWVLGLGIVYVTINRLKKASDKIEVGRRGEISG